MSSLSSLSSSSTHFILLQSSTVQTVLPVLRELVLSHSDHDVFLLCSLYAPSKLFDKANNVTALDWTAEIPGYTEKPINWDKRLDEVENLINKCDKPVCVFIDSVDTIASDLESSSKAYAIAKRILQLAIGPSARSTRNRQQSRLVAHMTSLCYLLPQMKQPRFSSSLTHIIAHPPALLAHIAEAYLICPPPSSRNESCSDAEALKFWRVFIPISERSLEIEQLVFRPATSSSSAKPSIAGECLGTGGISDEFVVEIITRQRGGASSLPASVATSVAAPRRKNTGVERILEGWSPSQGMVHLEKLKCLRGLWRSVGNGVRILQEEPDPTRNLTFNLSLTESQQASRAQVPLPYEHDGKAPSSRPESAQIFYDPDSADDLDDEDPDEDLDI